MRIFSTSFSTTTKEVRRIGRELAWGASQVLAVIFITGTALAYLHPVDSTDRSWFRRSGMRLYTDQATGIQYLGAGGALTPRLDRDGKPMLAR